MAVAFLRMELRAPNVPRLKRASEGDAVMRDSGDLAWVFEISVVGMDEVEPAFAFPTREHLCALSRTHVAPSHMRDLELPAFLRLHGRELPGSSLDPAEAGQLPFVAPLEHELHAEADAKGGHLSPLDRFVESFCQSRVIQPLHAGVEGAYPRQEDAVRSDDLIRIRRNLARNGYFLAHVLDRANVAHPVVDDRHHAYIMAEFRHAGSGGVTISEAPLRLSMKIWVLTVGEPLPIDGPAQRLLRTGLLVDVLRRRGHDVTWWSSTVDHFTRTQRADQTVTHPLDNGASLVLLYGRLYQRSISIARIVNHRETAAEFERLAPTLEQPDLILSSYPTLELCEAALEFAESRSIPVAVDVRDRWPHTFLEVVPGPIRTVGRPFLSPMFAQARRIFERADAILGNTEDMVEWGLRQSGHDRRPADIAFPFGYEPSEVSEEQRDEAQQFWDQEIGRAKNEFLIAFGGTLNHSFELETVIDAAQLLESRGAPVRWVICGQGDRLAGYRDRAKNLKEFHLMGWVKSPAMRVLLERADAGLMPYCANENFGGSIPNKCIEYMCFGLPVLSTLQTGTPRRALDEAGCGLYYSNGEPEQLVLAIESLLNAPERRDEVAKAAKGYFEANFRADAVYGRMADHLESLSRRPATAK